MNVYEWLKNQDCVLFQPKNNQGVGTNMNTHFSRKMINTKQILIIC